MYCMSSRGRVIALARRRPARPPQANLTSQEAAIIGYYNYALHIRRLKTPECAAGMLRALFQLSGADKFFMVCYGRPSLVLSHAQASTALHCISARISDSWASQPNKPNVHCQFECNNLYSNALLLTNSFIATF